MSHLFPYFYGNREKRRLVSMWAALFLSHAALELFSQGRIGAATELVG